MQKKRRAKAQGGVNNNDISHRPKRAKVELAAWQQKRSWDLRHEEAAVIDRNGEALDDKLIGLHNDCEEEENPDPDVLRASVRLAEHLVATERHDLAIAELRSIVASYRAHQRFPEEDRCKAEMAFAAALVPIGHKEAVSILSELRRRISPSLLLTCLILQAEALHAYGSRIQLLRTMKEIFEKYHGPDQAASYELRPLIDLLGVFTKLPRIEIPQSLTGLTEVLQGFVNDCQARLPKDDVWLQRIQIRLAETKLRDEQFAEGITILEPLVQHLCTKTGPLTDDYFWCLITLMELYEAEVDMIDRVGGDSKRVTSKLNEIQKKWSPLREWHSVVDNVRLSYHPNVPESDDEDE